MVWVYSGTGSCVAAGFENCCNLGNSPNCYGNPPSCFCDHLCYDFGDCCSDIEQVCAGMSTRLY